MVDICKLLNHGLPLRNQSVNKVATILLNVHHRLVLNYFQHLRIFPVSDSITRSCVLHCSLWSVINFIFNVPSQNKVTFCIIRGSSQHLTSPPLSVHRFGNLTSKWFRTSIVPWHGSSFSNPMNSFCKRGMVL